MNVLNAPFSAMVTIKSMEANVRFEPGAARHCHINAGRHDDSELPEITQPQFHATE